MPHSAIRWLVFDAVGTLIAPEPSVADIYWQFAQKYSSQLTREEIRTRFRTAFHTHAHRREPGLSIHQTSEHAEHDWWRRLVTEVLSDVSQPEACFQELYTHFARPTAWRVLPDVSPLLTRAMSLGLHLAVASNFDARLRHIASHLPPLDQIEHLVISSEVGWRKPAPQFYEALLQRLGATPEQILFIGDDLANDYEAPRSLGMHALLVGNHLGLAPLEAWLTQLSPDIAP